jgi:putative sterol carrier protein
MIASMPRARPDIEAIRRRFQQAFDPTAAGELEAVYQFEFGDAEGYHLVIVGGRLAVHSGEHPNPTIRLMFDRLDTATDVIGGEIDATQAFMEGRIRSDGNLLLAMRLGYLFPTGR